jgi:cellulose synthase/poly-beta-1,6-N-acetylglucosamine synthase-like glycosyltransferase
MSHQSLRLLDPRPAPPPKPPARPIGRLLVQDGVISQGQLIQALDLQKTLDAPVGEILISQGWARDADVQSALSRQHGVHRADLALHPPDPELCALKPAEFWLRHRVIPWLRLGKTVLIATSRPDRFDDLRMEMDDTGLDILPVLCSDTQIGAAISEAFRAQLAEAASTRVASHLSCRNERNRTWLILPVLGLAAIPAVVLKPLWLIAFLCCVAVATLVLFALLKLAAFVAHLTHHAHLTAPDISHPVPKARSPQVLPKVSVLVPLFRETEIAGALVKRLGRLTYPKALLDVILVLEEHDTLTHDTLARTELPSWMRVIRVPAHGGLTTKPRAMNYALDFCRGDIIGVWDAEDAPTFDQIERVAHRFAHAPEDVVCLQGILDYYNPRTNWLSRCFTIEYASWFRVVLPGIARLGLVVPLGGTTLFFKRKQLEELGGWDAHNVTEDADLGVRLCRAGYRTEMIETVTYEEANCRVWPWIKQRSRWLKGFMATYLVHMRNPRQLLVDLGHLRFWGLQAFFLGTLCQFLLAPVLWTFWLIVFGIAHPVQDMVPVSVVQSIAGLFVVTEFLAIIIAVTAVSGRERRFLIPWVVTMPLYYPLGVFAAYKALYELIDKPFYWDKTQHGHARPD